MYTFMLVGPSGVGKSHLAAELEKQGFPQLSRYVDRELRTEELNNLGDLVPLTVDEFSRQIVANEFIYWFQLGQNRYGYKETDIRAAEAKSVKGLTWVIPEENAVEVLKILPEVVTIYLYASKNTNRLMLERMLKRDQLLDYRNYFSIPVEAVDELLNSEFKIAVEPTTKAKLDKITQRLERNILEAEKVAQYKAESLRNPLARMFEIKDDRSLYTEVLPYMLAV